MRTFALDTITVTVANATVHLANYIVFAGIAAFFGATWQTDAFFLALTFPTFFVSAIVNAIGSVFIPIFAECRITRPQIMGQLIGSALLYALVGTLLIVFIIVVAVKLGFSQISLLNNNAFEFRQLVIQQTLLMLPVIVIQTLTGIISAFYNASGRFLIPPATDAISTSIVLVVIAISKSAIGIFSVPLGFVTGAVLHLLLLSMFWSRFDVDMVWTWKMDLDLKKSFLLSLPLIMGTAALQFGTIITRFLAAQLPVGSVTILDYANRISYGVMELLTSGVLLVILARWSQSANEDMGLFRREAQKITQMILFVVIPVVTIVVSLRRPLVAFAFQRGNFTEDMTIVTSGVLLFYMLGVPIDAVGRIYVRLLLIWKNNWLIGWFAVLRVLITVVAAILMIRTMNANGIAAAETVGLLFITGSFAYIAYKRMGNIFSGSGCSLLKIGISSLIASFVTVLVSYKFVESGFVKLAVASVAGGIIYLIFSHFLKSEQLHQVAVLLSKRSSDASLDNHQIL